MVIDREMLKKSSSQEPLDQFQPNWVGNMLGGLMRIQICSNIGAGPFKGSNKGQNKENI